MANQYFITLDENLQPTRTLEFTGGYQYNNRDSLVLFGVLDQPVDAIETGVEPLITINFDTNEVIPPPNTTGGDWADPGELADVVGEWVANDNVEVRVIESLEFVGISETYVIVDTAQPQYTEADVVLWAKKVTLWWLWNTHKQYVDTWHMLVGPTLTLADLDLDYQTQYTTTQNATTIAELKAITLIYPY